MSKKRLEEIEEAYRLSHKHIGAYVSSEGIEWLIKYAKEQAERADKNAQDLEEMDRRLYREQQQNKRYREALELIKTIGIYGKIISTGEIIRSDEANLAEEALEGDFE